MVTSSRHGLSVGLFTVHEKSHIYPARILEINRRTDRIEELRGGKYEREEAEEF